MALTKEESRVSLVGIAAALLGSLIGSIGGIWGTYAKFAEDQAVQVRDSRSRAYTQLKGQEAELIVLLQQWSVAHDKGTFYGVRAAQQMLREADRRRTPQAKVDNGQET